MNSQSNDADPILEAPECPNHNVPMNLKKVRYGQRQGERFWGCPNYSSDGCGQTKPFGNTETQGDTNDTDILNPEDYEDPGTCPKDGSELQLKRSWRGPFWSCTAPRCRGSRDAVRVGETQSVERSKSKVNWLDGCLDRPGWVCRYTNVGGTLRSSRNVQNNSDALHQVFVAQSYSSLTSDPEIIDVCAVLSKIMQRGVCPPIHPDAETKLIEMAGWSKLAIPSSLENDLTWGFGSDPAPSTSLDFQFLESKFFEPDPDIKYDSDDEKSFFEDWLGHLDKGRYQRWTMPQVQFSSIAPDSPPEILAQRTDFLIAPPGIKPIVVEIDGSQHIDSQAVDEQRDKLLNRAGIEVFRVPVTEVRAGKGDALSKISSHLSQMEKGKKDSNKAKAVTGSAQIHRFFLAVVDAIRGGILSGDQWSIVLDDSSDLTIELVEPYLKLIDAVSNLYGVNVTPDKVFIKTANKSVIFDKSNQFQLKTWKDEIPNEDLKISLEFEKSAIEELPSPPTEGAAHTVIRSANLPAIVGDDLFEGSLRKFVSYATNTSIKEPLTEILRAVFAKSDFKEGQYEAIEQLMTGNDCTVLLPTGAGKSFIYQIAGLCLPGRTLVIDPLIALMEDQERGLAQNGIDRVVTISSSDSRSGQGDRVLQEVRSGDALFIFVAPERLQKRNFRSALRALAQSAVINLVVIDEAHEVSEWGHSFRLSYLSLGRTLRIACRDSSGNHPPIVTLTGTASRAVLKDVINQLNISADSEKSIIRPVSFDRKELNMTAVMTSPDESEATLIGQLRSLPGRFGMPSSEFFRPRGPNTASGVVFCPHVSWERGVSSIAQLVRGVTGTMPSIYSGGIPQELRSRYSYESWNEAKRENSERFINNEASIIVTTNAFGMGIDKPNIRFVIHYGMPGSIEAFYQEVGRAGRNRDPATTVLILDELHAERNQKLLAGPLEETRRLHESINRRDSDDITRQLFFLLNTFAGVDPELNKIKEISEEISAQGAFGTVSTVELPLGDRDEKPDRERAIYRLMMVGAVSDYTVESKFEVTLSEIDSDGAIHSLKEFLDLHFPGRIASIPLPSSSLYETILESTELLINMIYDSVVASRLSSLNEMYLTARAASIDPTALRQRVLDYLTQGDVSPVFEALVDEEPFSFEAWSKELRNYRAEDAGELRGTAARLLISQTDHPGLLLARGYAEIVHPDGEPDTMEANIRNSALSALNSYGSTVNDLETMFAELLQLTRDSGGIELGVVIELAREFDVCQETINEISVNILKQSDSDIGLLVVAMRQLLDSTNSLVVKHMEKTL